MSALAEFGMMYAIGAVGFFAIQLAHNRRYGRTDPHYAEAWFVGAFWYPLMIWVLVTRAFRARP